MLVEISKKDGIIKNNSSVIILSLTEGKKKYLAKYILKKFLDEGKINRGQPIVVPTSGKMGLALAELYGMGNNPVFCVTSKKNPEYTEKIQELSNGNVFEVDSNGKLNMMNQRNFAWRKAKEIGGFYLDQYTLSEQEDCYRQLCNQYIPKEFVIDCYIENVATGGTFLGFYKELHNRNPSCRFFVTKVPTQSKEFFDGIPLLKKTEFEIIDFSSENIDGNKIIDLLKRKGINKKITFAYTALISAIQWANKNDNKTTLVFIGD